MDIDRSDNSCGWAAGSTAAAINWAGGAVESERDEGAHGDVGEEDMCVSEWGRCPWGRSASRVFVEAAGLVEKETRTPMGMSMRRKMKAICEPGDG